MAGRKNKYTVDYFPHYCNGVESKTMFILENKFGLIGYAIWYKTLELLGKTENHFIDLRDDTDLLFLVSKLGISEDKFIEIYNLLSKLGAIDLDLWNKKIIFSDNFVSNIEDAYVRRKGINVLHKIDLCKHLSIKCEQKLPKESKVDKSKLNKTKPENKPDLKEFMIYAKSKCKTEDEYKHIRDNLILKFNAWSEADWHDGYDNKIKRWKSKVCNLIPYLK